MFIILIYFIISGVFSKISNKTDYCSHPDCSLMKQHTMCQCATKHSPRLYASGMTTWMRYQIILLHNRYRDNIAMGLEAGQPSATNMRKMYWDYELEEIAEMWARQCQKRHDECRNTLRFNVLQNMDVRPIVSRVTEAQLLADAVGAWFSGSRTLPAENVWSFRQANCSAVGGCNANWYSAAAWASTYRLGCSQALCTIKQRPVCNQQRIKPLSNNETISNNETNTDTDSVIRRMKFNAPTSDLPRFSDYEKPTDPNKYNKPALYRGIKDLEDDKNGIDPKVMAYTFCNYGPAGNIDGFPIYEGGAPCLNCPQGTQCGDRTHRALCAVRGDPDLKQK